MKLGLRLWVAQGRLADVKVLAAGGDLNAHHGAGPDCGSG
ncbi:hypothetical protein GA0070616_0626 [Micromonospora nigra]|uniref:Uncharacterized protein n=1 Tax=Micromonospora nigra TaxID=145857 RepID=A0A1C6RD75_9ACTN|nr:hypothetical protein GA0070616_0626 [Micromonospora nigra]